MIPKEPGDPVYSGPAVAREQAIISIGKYLVIVAVALVAVILLGAVVGTQILATVIALTGFLMHPIGWTLVGWPGPGCSPSSSSWTPSNSPPTTCSTRHGLAAREAPT